MTMLNSLKVACANCSLQQLCVPVGLEGDEFSKLEAIVGRGRPLVKGSHIYLPADNFNSLYAIRAGAVKTYTISTDGEEHVTGFYLPGEVIGLDAVCSGTHPCGARTLETTSLCELPFDRLEDLAAVVPSISRQLLRIMSQELRSDEQLLMMVGSQSAEARLASLFLSLSMRLNRRGYSATEFNLSMSRADIGSFLGLAVETVSRLIKRMQENKLVSINHREVKLLDLDKLRTIAGKGANSIMN
ncbi:fumarate/nitrate reduction transcriptional regulator [Gammaproteobacteria bacterium]|nr:fumarate/nitrate reduction transcriptional regulator [Gammaproteobacteria bacterium]